MTLEPSEAVSKLGARSLFLVVRTGNAGLHAPEASWEPGLLWVRFASSSGRVEREAREAWEALHRPSRMAGTVLTLPISGVKVLPSCPHLGSLYSLSPSSSVKCWPPSSAWAGLMIPCASVSSEQPPAHLASLVLCGIPLLQVLLPSSWAPRHCL